MKTRRTAYRRTRLALGVAVCLLAMGDVVWAANTCQWTGAGVDGNWSRTANWTACGGGHPVNGDAVVFPNGAAQPANQNDLAGLSLVSVSVLGTGAGNHHWDIFGVGLTVTSTVAAAAPRDIGGAGPSFRAPITVGSASVSLQNNDAGAGGTAPFLIGDIALNGFTVSAAANFPLVIGGMISGNGGLLKDALSSLTVSNGGNSYTGLTTVKKGTLIPVADHALGATGTGNETRVLETGQLVLASNIVLIEPLLISGYGGVAMTDGAVSVAAGVTPTLAGPVALPIGAATFPSIAVDQNATLTISGPVDLTEGGNVTNSVLIKNGLGTLSFSNPANHWQAIDLRTGTVRVLPGAAGAIPIGSEVDIAIAGTFDLNNIDTTLASLQGGNAMSGAGVVQLGSGTLTVNQGFYYGTITGAGGLVSAAVSPGFGFILGGPLPNTFTGTTTINPGGTLLLRKNAGVTALAGPVVVNGALDIDNNEQIANSAPVIVNGAGRLGLNEHAASGAVTVFETIGSLAGDGHVELLSARLAIGADNTSTTFSGLFTGFAPFDANGPALTKMGTGTLTVSSQDGTSGGLDLRIISGTALLNGAGIARVEVGGGILGGTGTISGGVTVSGGTVSPGAGPGTSPGILHLASQVALSAGALAIELNGPAAGTGYDQLDLSPFLGSDLTLSGPAALQVTRGYGPPLGTHFTIVSLPAGFTVTGAFVGLPEGASFLVNQQRFGISYHGGDGNDVVLTALEDPPSLSIDDVTVTEGDTGTTTSAVFTVTLSRALTSPATVQYATANGTATSPQDYVAQSGTLTFAAGVTTQTVTIAVDGDRSVEADETFAVQLSNAQGAAAIARAQGTGTIVNDDLTRTYYLSEGATGGFFDEDVLIANPNAQAAPVTLTFSKEDGQQVVTTRTLPPQSHLTVHVDQIAGLEATAASTQVTSDAGLPLVVERSMFWDATYYAGHTGSAVDQPAPDWFFAEGSQGFFQTFVLVINPNPTPTDVTFTFLREGDTPVVKTVTVGAATRLTLDAGSVPEIVNRSFGIAVHATQPIMAERSMYFGTTPTRLWSGGTESAGVTAGSTHWFLAEGATGGFFDTFVLLSNPQSTPAHVSMTYLLDTGETVTVAKTIPANARLTTNIEAEDDVRLHSAAVSTVVTADVPIIAERSMYWPGAAIPWGEGHNSFGVVDAGTAWGLAEGRVGTPLNFHTYILLANPQATAAAVTVTYLRESGAPVVKTYSVPATSRFNIDTSTVTELHDEAFGATIQVTNGVAIIVERSMYWDANGFLFSGGTNATGTRLP
jgi:hypothetical protein